MGASAQKKTFLRCSSTASVPVPVIAGSDAHIWLDVGNLTRSETFLQDARFPASLVLNTTKEGLLYVLNDTPRRERFAASLSE